MRGLLTGFVTFVPYVILVEVRARVSRRIEGFMGWSRGGRD